MTPQAVIMVPVEQLFTSREPMSYYANPVRGHRRARPREATRLRGVWSCERRGRLHAQ